MAEQESAPPVTDEVREVLEEVPTVVSTDEMPDEVPTVASNDSGDSKIVDDVGKGVDLDAVEEKLSSDLKIANDELHETLQQHLDLPKSSRKEKSVEVQEMEEKRDSIAKELESHRAEKCDGKEIDSDNSEGTNDAKNAEGSLARVAIDDRVSLLKKRALEDEEYRAKLKMHAEIQKAQVKAESDAEKVITQRDDVLLTKMKTKEAEERAARLKAEQERRAAAEAHAKSPRAVTAGQQGKIRSTIVKDKMERKIEELFPGQYHQPGKEHHELLLQDRELEQLEEDEANHVKAELAALLEVRESFASRRSESEKRRLQQERFALEQEKSVLAEENVATKALMQSMLEEQDIFATKIIDEAGKIDDDLLQCGIAIEEVSSPTREDSGADLEYLELLDHISQELIALTDSIAALQRTMLTHEPDGAEELETLAHIEDLEAEVKEKRRLKQALNKKLQESPMKERVNEEGTAKGPMATAFRVMNTLTKRALGAKQAFEAMEDMFQTNKELVRVLELENDSLKLEMDQGKDLLQKELDYSQMLKNEIDHLTGQLVGRQEGEQDTMISLHAALKAEKEKSSGLAAENRELLSRTERERIKGAIEKEEIQRQLNWEKEKIGEVLKEKEELAQHFKNEWDEKVLLWETEQDYLRQEKSIAINVAADKESERQEAVLIALREKELHELQNERRIRMEREKLAEVEVAEQTLAYVRRIRGRYRDDSLPVDNLFSVSVSASPS